MDKLKLAMVGDTCIVGTRRFSAPPIFLYTAFTEVEYLQQWLNGPGGWKLTQCINAPQPGGRIRYDWSDSKGNNLYLTGHYIELIPFSKIVHVERMHLPEPTPDQRITTTFEPDGLGTLLTFQMLMSSSRARAAVLATGLERGMETCYEQLESLFYQIS